MTGPAAAGRFERAIAAIDEANAADPNTIVVAGETRPKELAHAELMTRWVQRLDPTADEAQLLAARAHHLRRWVVPRSSEEPGRAGYLRWRSGLGKRQAAEVGEILDEAGYDGATVARVQAIVAKRGAGTDPAVQVHEDALCLVFLETQLTSTAEQLGDDKVVDIVAKTARKMSPAGLAMVAELGLDERGRALVARAVG